MHSKYPYCFTHALNSTSPDVSFMLIVTCETRVTMIYITYCNVTQPHTCTSHTHACMHTQRLRHRHAHPHSHTFGLMQ